MQNFNAYGKPCLYISLQSAFLGYYNLCSARSYAIFHSNQDYDWLKELESMSSIKFCTIPKFILCMAKL